MSESTPPTAPKVLRIAITALLPLALALGQADKPPLRFEVCDIQLNKIRDRSQIRADFLPGGRVDVRGVPLLNIIARVYGVSGDRVIGPGWMSSDQYDVVAKAPPDSTESQLYEMARNELAERFKMVVHTGKKEMRVYALVQGPKGAKLTPATDSAASRPPIFHDMTCPMYAPEVDDPPGTAHRKCLAVSMSDLAKMLPQMAPAYLEDQPVVDLTGLKGVYDFSLYWLTAPAYKTASEAGSAKAISIFDAVDSLGLKLESRKYPMDTIVIDSIQRKPV